MTEIWRMGANPVSVTQTGEIARRFEAEGWDGLAVAEAHGILPDPYAVLALAAAATTTLRIGTAVAVPIRHPILAAGAMATIQAVSSGRARFGIGRGDSAVKLLHQEPMRVAQFGEYLKRLQGYLKKEDVDIDGNVSSMARMYAVDPGADVPPPPIDVAATGPRMTDLAARIADGVVVSVGADLDRLRNSIEQVRATGHNLEMGCYVQVAVIDAHDQSGREAIRGIALTHARFSGFEAKPTRADVSDSEHAEYRHAVDTMEKIWRSARGGLEAKGDRPGEVDLYPEQAASAEMIDRWAIVGTGEQCAERLQAIIDLGFDRLMLGTHTAGVDLEERNTTRIAREVLPLLRR